MRRILRLMLVAAGSYAPQFRSTLRVATAASVLQAAAFAVFVPLIVALAEVPVDPGRVWPWLVLLAVLVAGEGVLRVREEGFLYRHWHLVIEELRLRIGRALRSMPQQELARRAAGDLTTVAGTNVASATAGISTLATLFLSLVTVPALLGVLVLVLDWRLGLVLVAATLAALPLLRRVQTLSNAGFRRIDTADAASADRIVEYVQGLAVLRATGNAGADSPRLVPVLTEQHHAQADANRSSALPVAAAQLLVQLAIVALVALGAALVLGASLPAPLLVAVVVTAARFAEPLALVTQMVKLFELTEAALSRIDDVLDVEPLPVRSGGREPHEFDVVFEDVTFTYDGQDEPTLGGVDLTFPARGLTALVGPSGSGKTTITKLISRWADPQSGTVRMGGVDIASLEPDALVRHLAVVFQDVYLFDDTIRANIAMSRPDATDAEVEAAARSANVHEFVAGLPHGYATRVGELGGTLSGGERQRISIARAILKDAPVVILDEPTAALDTESEVAVQRAIDALIVDRTVIVIAHRLSTVVGADQIVVLDGGRVVESGTHAELLADASGRYTRMWAAQMQARHWNVTATRSGEQVPS